MSERNEQFDNAKKSEAIEVRLSHEKKLSFMEACKERNDTASGVLRQAIDSYLSPEKNKSKPIGGKEFLLVTAGALIGIAAWYGIADQKVSESNESLLQAGLNPLTNLYFDQIDANNDNRLTRQEFVSNIESRGTVSTARVKPTETILRTVGVALIVPSEDVAKLKENDKLSGCFETLSHIGNSERAREFYELDTNNDNQLTLVEMSKSRRLPTLYELQQEFAHKDSDQDGYLSKLEAAEDVDIWLEHNATEENARTETKETAVPEACQASPLSAGEGRLLVKFEKLKRYIDTREKGGVTDKRFQNIDADRDGALTFTEFLGWYLQPAI